MDKGFDPILTEVIWARLVSIADEQAKALFRSSFSTAVGESEDFASTIHDARGRMIAQSVSTGTISMLTGLTRSVQELARRFAGRLQDGDAIICNDPWLFSGHTYDVVVATPIFAESRLLGWGVTCLHAADIGGGGFSANAHSAYEEGLHIPPMLVMRAGEPNRELLDIVERNVRMPHLVVGDMQAQVAANEVAAAKLRELLTEYGLDSLDAIADAIISRSEHALREAVRALPNGSYRHTTELDGREHPLRIVATAEVSGDQLTVDFAGTSDQVGYGINGVFNVTFGWTAHAVKTVLAPALPNNEGFFRAMAVVAPAGSLVNAHFPAPTAGRHLLYTFLSGAVFGALSQAAPAESVADSGIQAISSIDGVDPAGDEFAYWFLVNNGMGATALHDGYSGTSYPPSVPAPSVEIVENVSPVFVERLELRPGSGGPGRTRGGLAHDLAFRVRSATPVRLACMFERVHSPAMGLHGGGPGATGYVHINGKPVDPKGRHTITELDVVRVSGGGGGGYCSPLDRDPHVVGEDVADGVVTGEQAREDYGVAIDEEGTVNFDETARLRAEARRDQ